MNNNCHLPHPHDKADPAQLAVTGSQQYNSIFFFVEHTTKICKSLFPHSWNSILLLSL